MTRQPLPPYGNALMRRRRGGDHPLCVHVIWGYRWNQENACWWQSIIAGAHPLLAVKPRDFAPERYDWSVVTGLQVCVFDQIGASQVNLKDGPPPQWWHDALYACAGEIGRYAADVELYSPALDVGRWSLRDLAQAAVRENGGRWPHWWSPEIAEQNAQRIRTWTNIVFGKFAEPAAA